MDSLYINGQWSQARGSDLHSFNPVSSHIIWTGKSASVNDVDEACMVAQSSFEYWSKLSLDERFSYIAKFRDLLKEKQEIFAKTICLETGKALWESKQEVSAMIAKVDISYKAFLERSSIRESEISEGTWSKVRYKAIGVMAVFGPFNFPGHLPNGHIVPALIAGNTVVFKPSDQTPLCGELMVQLWEEAGLPKGVLNLVQGARETGEALVQNVDVRGVLFTGSYQTGRAIHKALAGYPEKILALEMGGNNPLIVHKPSDIDACVYTIIQSAFITAGQRCVCARRLIITEESDVSLIIEKLIEKTKALTVGDPHLESEPFYGSMISESAADLVLSKEAQLIQAGAKIHLKAERDLNCKAIIRPSILDVTSLEERDDEECFGPLLQLVKVKDLTEAVYEANNTKYGLSAGILCHSEADYQYFLEKSTAGIVNWNRQITGAVSSAPFGGTGKSGNYRPSAYFASDYCSYSVASIEVNELKMPESLSPGINWS